MKKPWLDILLSSISYVLVAAAASAVTMLLCAQPAPTGADKLDELENLIDTYFINDVDSKAIQDGAAAGMVEALGDRWSYYLAAEEYITYQENMANAYVGIGVTITIREDGQGFDVLAVEPGGPAQDAGMLPGDIIVAVEGENAFEMGTTAARNRIRGEVGTDVRLTIRRNGKDMDLVITRGDIQVQVASGQMLEGNVGLVKIANFDSRCSQETIAVIQSLQEQGAEALIFDIRNNPGGYKKELVDLLDYLLPKGVLFRGISYDGSQRVEESDAKCLEMPMAVLINENTYSAAEFFAAALEEYDWAFTVGQPTCGKSYFQQAFVMSDGSAVSMSIGKYFTPNGVSLAEVGGLVPGIPVEVDGQTAAMIYSGAVDPMEDPQILAALEALK